MNTQSQRRIARLFSAIFLIVNLFVGANALAQDSFDHFTTGFNLDGAHRNVSCDRCHSGGVFEGTSRTCVGCHSQIGTVLSSMKPPGHISSMEICADCHTTSAWSPVAFMDHTAIFGSCGTCHNGALATGKTPDHIASSAQCDDCHNSNSWIPAVFDHANVTGNCFGCHNGVDATGKSPLHVQTTNVCEDCHNSIVWAPVNTVDHTQVLGSCSSCHNGITATGKHPTHIISGDTCDDCHTSVAWTPANFDHANITGGCASCHNGTDATGKNPGHFVTAQQCEMCHVTNAWIPDIFAHRGLAFEPLDHRGNLPCTSCHLGNSELVTYTAPAYQPDCAGCHANSYRPGPHKKHENPDVRYTVSELRNCSGACHVYTDATLITIKKNRPGPEHRVSDGSF